MAKFDQIESAIVSLDKQVKILAADLQKLITAFNSQSKGQGDLAKKTNAVSKAVGQVSVVEKELESIRKRSLKTTKETIAAKEQLRKKTKALTDADRKANGVLKKSGGLFRSMTKSILAAGAAMLTLRAAFLVIKNGFKTIVQFEKGMSAVRAITGATAKEFKTLQKNALLLGSTTSKTALQVAQLQVEFAKLGFSTSEILAATSATIDLSIAAGTDLAEAAVVAASTVRGFGLSATETQRVVDVMAKSFSSSALDLEKFKIAMSKVAPIARASGKSIEFTTSQLAILSDAGLEASIAGTSLRNIFLELNKQGLTWEQGLEKINTSTNKNTTALQLFGKRGATAALVLAENTLKAEELEVALDGAAGAAREMADIMEDNVAGDIKKATSAWEGFILGLNDGTGALSNAGRNLIQFGTRAIRSLNTLDLWFKSEKRFTSGDFDRLLENMEFVKTESGKRVVEIIDHFEDLNKGISTEELIKDWSTFRELFKEEGEDINAIQGLWAAYGRQKQSQIEADKQAEIDSAAAIIKANEETARVKAALAEEEAKEQDKITAKNIKRLKRELEEKEKLQLKAVEDSNKLSDSLVDEEIRLADEELERLAKQLDDEFKLQQEAAKKELELEKEKQDLKNEIKEAALDAAGQIVTDRLTAGIEEDIARLSEAKDTEQKILDDKLDKGLISEKEFKKKSAALDLKFRQDQAKASKKAAIFEIAIATLVAVAKAGFVTPAAIAAGAAGALSGVVVAAKPIPQFEHGTNGQLQLATDAIVGEAGTELVTTKQGSFLTPDSATKVHLPANSQVFSHDSPETQAALSGGISEERFNTLINEQKLTRKAIQKQPKNITNIAPETFERSYESGRTRVKFMDDWIRR